MIAVYLAKMAVTLFCMGFPVMVVCACLSNKEGPWTRTDRIGMGGLALVGGAAALIFGSTICWVWGI